MAGLVKRHRLCTDPVARISGPGFDRSIDNGRRNRDVPACGGAAWRDWTAAFGGSASALRLERPHLNPNCSRQSSIDPAHPALFRPLRPRRSLLRPAARCSRRALDGRDVACLFILRRSNAAAQTLQFENQGRALGPDVARRTRAARRVRHIGIGLRRHGPMMQTPSSNAVRRATFSAPRAAFAFAARGCPAGPAERAQRSPRGDRTRSPCLRRAPAPCSARRARCGRCDITMTMLLLRRKIWIARVKRFLAFGVEIGVRLIEHDQERIAEYGPRKPDSLPLPCGQRHAALRRSASRILPAGAG